jgi:predicted phosphodiesterase
LQLTDCNITKAGIVTSVYMPDSAVTDFQQKLFLMSDIHFDSIYCDRKLLKRDLDIVKREDKWIIIAGDFWDAMQGKKDPRGRLDELRTELKTEKYFDALVDTAIQYLEPYHENILLMGYGNHETSVIRHNGTDLIQRTVGALNQGKKHRIQTGGYAGWIRFMFQSKNNTSRGRIAYNYHHGKGGSAFVTDGIMDDKRAGVYIPDADIVHFGHNHKEYAHPVARQRLNGKGIVESDYQLYVRSPGYKSPFAMDQDGLSWDVSNGTPTPLGSITVDIGFPDKRPKILGYSKVF